MANCLPYHCYGVLTGGYPTSAFFEILRTVLSSRIEAPIVYVFPSCNRQHTRCTYMQHTRSTLTLVHFVASYAACARGAGPHVYCLVREMESDEEVLQAYTAIVVADALLEKPNRSRKKWVNDYLLARTTNWSYGGLLTELSFEKDRKMAAKNVDFFLIC